jgi:hypothetical protein
LKKKRKKEENKKRKEEGKLTAANKEAHLGNNKM